MEPSQELDALARNVIGAAIEVHRVLGPGFLEAVYEDALCLELARRGLPFERQVAVTIEYKGTPIAQARLDLVVAAQLVLELKAVPQLVPLHQAQLLSYLSAMKQPLGLLINFQVPYLRMGIRRVILSV